MSWGTSVLPRQITISGCPNGVCPAGAAGHAGRGGVCMRPGGGGGPALLGGARQLDAPGLASTLGTLYCSDSVAAADACISARASPTRVELMP